MLKISHLPRIMIRMKRKGKAAVGGRVYQRSVCRYHEARYLTRPDIRDECSIVPYRLHLGSYRKYMSFREGTLLSKIVLHAMFVITESIFGRIRQHFKMYAPLASRKERKPVEKVQDLDFGRAAAALCLLCGCSAEDFALPHEVQLAVGQQCALAGELPFTGSPFRYYAAGPGRVCQAVTDAVVHIASTDPSVAAVDQDGNVTAVTPGTATVLVSCVDLDFYAEVNINVVEAATPESAALATPETAAQSTPKQPRRRVLNPQRLKLLLLQRPLPRKRLPPKVQLRQHRKAPPHPKQQKRPRRKLRPRPKCQEQPKPQLQPGKKQRLLTKKQENRSANF